MATHGERRSIPDYAILFRYKFISFFLFFYFLLCDEIILSEEELATISENQTITMTFLH